jgi:hypothetical protein
MTTTTAGLNIRPVHWRLLNALDGFFGPDWDQIGTFPESTRQASELAASQHATVDHLRWLGEHRLVQATLHGTGTRLSLLEHLTYGGSPTVIALRLNRNGHRMLAHDQNKVLRTVFGTARRSHRLTVQQLQRQTGVDRHFVDELGERGLLAFRTSLGDDLPYPRAALLPDATLYAHLGRRGRSYLPLDA